MQYTPDAQIPHKHADILKVKSTIGVYLYLKQGRPVYIGKAVHLKSRLLSHEHNARTDPKEAKIVQESDAIDLIYTDSEFLALVLEAKLISAYQPRYNVRWRDDKSYLYIKITTKDTYPKVLITRREDDGRSKYFGPFDSLYSVEGLLKQIRRIVPFCTQKSIHTSGCFYHKIGLCDPCPNRIERMDAHMKKIETARYRAHIRTVVRILEGKTDLVSRTLRKQLKDLTLSQRYEEALKIRDTIKRLELLIAHGSFREEDTHPFHRSEGALTALRDLLRPFFPDIPPLRRIECYDTSTLSFQHSTASMVVFTDGMVDKKEYRRFRLNSHHMSDFTMMQEVLDRRIRNTRWEKPDLIVIDGGKPQLLAVRKILKSKFEIRNNKATHVDSKHGTRHLALGTIPLIGLAKNPDRIVIGVEHMPTIRPMRHDQGYRLLQQIRDEAHRFAKKYHSYLRRKSQMVQ